MASRLNLLFQNAPKQFLERTVLFTDELTSPESTALMRHKQMHHVDLQPLQTRSSARVLPNINAYADMPLTSYFVPAAGYALIPKEEPPARFIFLPEFVGCRLLVRPEETTLLRIECEQGLNGSLPPIESQKDSHYVDSFAYWDYTRGHLVGRIRATAVLVKEPGEPWTVYMQQIVGTPGFEIVRSLFSRPLRY
jgi:hypothetical protein